MTEWQPIEYYHDDKSNIVLPTGAPFDGEEVLLLTGLGVVEARWMGWEPSPTLEDPNDGDGWCWVCLDDSAPALELDARPYPNRQRKSTNGKVTSGGAGDP